MEAEHVEHYLREIASALTRLADAADRISAPNPGEPKFTKTLAEYPGFDWQSIGAKVVESESWEGHKLAKAVEWKGVVWKRRFRSKYGNDIWFSRAIGRENEENIYAHLILFKEYKEQNQSPVESLDSKVLQALKNVIKLPVGRNAPVPAPDNSNQNPRPAQPVETQQITPEAIDQNARIRAVRTLTGHSADQVKTWLSQYGAKAPVDLNSFQCDALVKWLCISWAFSRLGNQHLASESYTKFVPGAIASGQKEEEAVRDWMRQVEKEVEGANKR